MTSRVRDIVKSWVQSRWFAPDALRSGALTDTLKAIYLPYWTFDASAHADWTAMSGDYYYTTEAYTDCEGPAANAAGAARPLVSERRPTRSLLRR